MIPLFIYSFLCKITNRKLVAIVLAVIFLHEAVTRKMVAGALLIIGGCLIFIRK
ncbi:MAG TPA: hypothetical protein VM101_09175 [Flavitalea sp.]|nr:hypothetical protein [Flavitalea sp.]